MEEGDRVVFTDAWTSFNVAWGDVGTVDGPGTSDLADNDQRVCVDFGAGKADLAKGC